MAWQRDPVTRAFLAWALHYRERRKEEMAQGLYALDHDLLKAVIAQCKLLGEILSLNPEDIEEEFQDDTPQQIWPEAPGASSDAQAL